MRKVAIKSFDDEAKSFLIVLNVPEKTINPRIKKDNREII